MTERAFATAHTTNEHNTQRDKHAKTTHKETLHRTRGLHNPLRPLRHMRILPPRHDEEDGPLGDEPARERQRGATTDGGTLHR